MKITVVGTGYVGMSIGVLLSQYNEVVFLDVDEDRLKLVNKRRSPIQDNEIDHFLSTTKLNISTTLNEQEAYRGADFVIVATPTNYDEESNSFDTSTVESVLSGINRFNPHAVSVIKSTIPVGFTQKIQKKLGNRNILFSPEFLREGHALFDNLYPTRIVVGEISERATVFAKLLQQASKKNNVPTFFTNSAEAEAIKLFANTYLAMRVAFFNELDSYSAVHKLNTKQIIDCMCLDPRIGAHYNNPSFGYGGYCLPKDTKQLLANFANTPQQLMKAIVQSNETRKSFIASEILESDVNTIGIYRLSMKIGSDNYRASSILGVIEKLKNRNKKILIFEPSLNEKEFMQCEVITDIEKFKSDSELIVCNRKHNDLCDVNHKIYTRDIYGND